LNSVCKEFLSKDVPFNEVLSCAYKVGFHFPAGRVILIGIHSFRRNKRWVFILIVKLAFRERLQVSVLARPRE